MTDYEHFRQFFEQMGVVYESFSYPEYYGDEWRERLLAYGLQVTDVKDRQYFRSIYFRDPQHTGGVLFEIATDGPGFLINES